MADSGVAQKAKTPLSSGAVERPRPLGELATLFAAQPQQYAAEYGAALLSAGRAADALVALQKVHAALPLTGRARVVLAQAHFDSFDVASAEQLLVEQRKALDGDAWGQRLLGELQLEKGQKQEAIASLKSAYALDSHDRRTRELLVMLGQLDKRDLRASEAPLAPFLEDESTNAAAERNAAKLKGTLQKAGITAVVMIAFISIYAWRVGVEQKVNKLVAEGKADRQKNDLPALLRAEKKYQEAIDAMGGHHGALSGLGEVEAFLVQEHGRKDNEPALKDISKRLVDKGINSGERFFAEASTLLAAGNPSVADQMLETTIKNGGIDSRVLYASGLSSLAVDKFGASKDALRKAYELDPFHPAIAATLGDVFAIEGDLKNADFYYRKAVDANLDHTRAVARSLWSRLMLGEDPAALQVKVQELLAKKAEASPAHQIALSALDASFNTMGGDRAKGKAAATQLLTTYKDDPWMVAAMSQVLLQTGDKAGLAGLESLLKRFGSLPRVTLDVARAAARFGKVEDADAKVKADKDLYESAKGQAFLGHLYLNAGNAKVAGELFDKALKQDEKNAEAIYGVGRLAHSKKDWEKALASYARALELRPSYADVYQQVGNIYVENKEYDNARTNFGMAEKLFRQTAAPVSSFNTLYEDVAKSYDKQGGKDGAATAAKWRAKIKKS